MTDEIMYGLICAGMLITLDYVTGIIKAIINKTLSSQKMREGLSRKFAYIVVIFLAWFIQFESTHIDLDFKVPVFIPTIIGISLIEITSILENCVEINPELKDNHILDIFNTSNNNTSNNNTSNKDSE